MHVTLKLKRGLPSLRNRKTLHVLLPAFDAGKERFGFRLNHFVVMGNHLHLIIEADDRGSLTRGLGGIAIRIAKALNRLWGRKGAVLFERFHEHVPRTPLEVRRALLYVLRNACRHGASRVSCAVHAAFVDPFSSGAWFDGWRGAPDAPPRAIATPVSAPSTWLQRLGWRRHGLIGGDEAPSGSPLAQAIPE